MAFAAVAAILRIFLLDDLCRTRVGARSVDGVQGRYFVPGLPHVKADRLMPP
ncbi:hypothetical protein [Lichenicola sp.]|uniref:hypothetical protein n=1 Tax=Lichenicola sp. TaxID=2804529 RepID=UPI003AFFF994